MTDIVSFALDGPHGFLSNFYPSPICARHPFRDQRGVYPTVEHMFQAWKATTAADHDYVADASTPGLAKSRGRHLRDVRRDWDTLRLQVMATALTAKFKPGSALAQQLLATGDSRLIEGNDWGDRFWGAEYTLIDANTGEWAWVGYNHLGRLLMERREEIRTYHLTDAEFRATL